MKVCRIPIIERIVICLMRTKKRKNSMESTAVTLKVPLMEVSVGKGQNFTEKENRGILAPVFRGNCCNIIDITVTQAHFLKVTRLVDTNGLTVSPQKEQADGIGTDGWQLEVAAGPLGDRRQPDRRGFIGSRLIWNICHGGVLIAGFWVERMEILHKRGSILTSDCVSPVLLVSTLSILRSNWICWVIHVSTPGHTCTQTPQLSCPSESWLFIRSSNLNLFFFQVRFELKGKSFPNCANKTRTKKINIKAASAQFIMSVFDKCRFVLNTNYHPEHRNNLLLLLDLTECCLFWVCFTNII